MLGTGELLSTFDIGDMGTEALLFQAGYLTITEEKNYGSNVFYRLGYPNPAVRRSLREVLRKPS